MGMRWVSVSVRGMLRGCGAVNRAHHRAGLLRRTRQRWSAVLSAPVNTRILYIRILLFHQDSALSGGPVPVWRCTYGGYAMIVGRDTRVESQEVV